MSIKQISEINNNQNSVDKTNYNNNINVTNSDNLNLDTTINTEEMDLDAFFGSSSTTEQKNIMDPSKKMNLIKDLKEKYNINIDSSSEIESMGDWGGIKIYRINDKYINIYPDGTIEIDTDQGLIDATGANEIAFNKDELIIKTNNGTFNISEDNKTSYVDLDGNSYTINCSIIKLLFNYSNENNNIIDINKITIDKEGKICYLDKEITTDKEGNINYLDKGTNSTYIFDNLNRITTFIKGDVRVDYNYNPTEEDIEEIKNLNPELYGDGNYNVNYVATTTIRGHKLKYYSIGEQNETDTTRYPIAASLAYSQFNDRILNLIENHFKGTIIGPWELSSLKDEPEKQEVIGGYYSEGEDFIFIPYDYANNNTNDCYSDVVPIHEMGHYLQYWTNLDIKYKEFSKGDDKEMVYEKIAYFYDRYKEQMPTLEKSGYDSSRYKESPNSHEFFADATANYFLNPDELKRYAPDLYEFLNELYGEKEVYGHDYKRI